MDPETSLVPVVDLVAAAPGLTRAAAVKRLGMRRVTALGLLDRAVGAGLVHEGESVVASCHASTRTVRGLYPGPPPAPGALFDAPGRSGEELQGLRRRAGVSLSDLAACLGVSRGLVHAWESGRRQSIPPWANARLRDALEQAQKIRRPQHRRQGRRLAEMLAEIRERPGISRWALAGRRITDRRLLDDALVGGQIHEAPAYTADHQEVLGLYIGGQPRESRLCPVRGSDLREARQRAGWSRVALAQRLGVSTRAAQRYELYMEHVPGWLTERATAVLAEARAAARDFPAEHRNQVLAELRAAGPEGLTYKELRRRLGWGPRIREAVAVLEHEERIHRRHAGRAGEQTRLHLGPAAVEVVLTGEQLRELRESRGLWQADAGALVGIGKVLISQYEAGERRMSIERQLELREKLEALPVPGPEQVPVLITPEQLKAARRKAGLTQGQLADRIGLANGAPTISEWEKGRRPMPLSRQQDLVEELAEALGAAATDGGAVAP